MTDARPNERTQSSEPADDAGIAAHPMTVAAREFVEEGREALLDCERALDRLAAEPAATDALDELLRSIHSTKGSAAVLGFSTTATLAHALESALEGVLARGGVKDPGDLTTLRSAVEMLDDLLSAAKRPGRRPEPAIHGIVAELQAMGGAPEEGTAGNENERRLGDVLVSGGAADRLAVELAAAEQVLGDQRRLGQILVERGDASVDRVAAALTTQLDAVARQQSIRVDLTALDDLTDLVGQLRDSAVELDRLLRADAPTARMLAATAALRDLSRRADATMAKSRRQPLRVIWRRLPRILRHTAAALGKEIDIVTEGDGIEVDTALLQACVAPITHLVRNAVDHGIEAPGVRVGLGKHPSGEIRLSATVVEDELVIEVADDGGGLDLEALRAKAVERSLMGPGTAARLTDTQAAELVFLPGLSTADALTQISGRGVGLDVVRSAVTALGGSLHVTAERGIGSTFVLTLPLDRRGREETPPPPEDPGDASAAPTPSRWA